MTLTPTQPQLNPPSSPSCGAGRKLGDVATACLWHLLRDDPPCPSRLRLDKGAQTPAPLESSVRHRQRLRHQWQRNGPTGRPRHPPGLRSAAARAAVVQMRPPLPSVGVHLFAHWLDQPGAFDPIVAPLTQAIEADQQAHPGDDFPLGHHRDPTLHRRWQALFFAPLLGLEPRTAFDTHAQPLATVLGQSAPRATLPPLLGQLERVGADEALRPTLRPAPVGHRTSMDGPRIASWSRVARPKGKRTRRGRIMAGSHAGIAHNEAGHALLGA